MAKSKLVKANRKIAEEVVGGYKKIEHGVVNGFGKMTDTFVDNFLTKDDETVEEAKKRLEMERKTRQKDAQERLEESRQTTWEQVDAARTRMNGGR